MENPILTDTAEDGGQEINEENDAVTGKRGRPFEHGNTFGQGRPKGSLNKKTLLLQQMLLDGGPEIVLSAYKLAKKRNRVARALLVERLIPRLKDVKELRAEQSDNRENEFRVVYQHRDEDGRIWTPEEWKAREREKAAQAKAAELAAVKDENPSSPSDAEPAAQAKPEPLNIESARNSLSRMPEAKPMNRSQTLSDQGRRRNFIVPKSPWV